MMMMIIICCQCLGLNKLPIRLAGSRHDTIRPFIGGDFVISRMCQKVPAGSELRWSGDLPPATCQASNRRRLQPALAVWRAVTGSTAVLQLHMRDPT